MPINKHLDIRLRVLDNYLRRHKDRYDLDALTTACAEALFEYDGTLGITSRQIRKDIEYLESEQGYRARLERYRHPEHPRKILFRYQDPDFSISQQPLSREDAHQLQETLLTLQRFKGLPQFDWIQELSVKLQKLLDTKISEIPVISFDNNAKIKGLEWIDPIYKAIVNKQNLKITYVPFFENQVIHHVSPYLLKEFNNRWFVLSKSDQENFFINLALDRIEALEFDNSPYEAFPKENPEDFFDPIIGVTNHVDEPIQEIVLQVEKTLFPYIETKPIHHSQKILNPLPNGDWITISIQVRTNYEFFSLILSHGPRIQIVSPDKSRMQMQVIVEKIKNLYFL
jgi:predicted DNA-binding transcriptional regulator YafY